MQSEFIVLRKTPYRENALVLSGISPDFGKLEVIAYGAAGSSKPNSFPVADIYRVLSVTLKDNDLEQGKNGLLAAKDIELIEDFPDLPRKLDNLKFIGKIGGFLLRNTVFESPLPLVYDALRSLLRILSNNEVWSQREAAIVIKLTFLYENGLLPEPENMSAEAAGKVMMLYEKIIECAVDAEPLPKLSVEYYLQLDSYLNMLITRNQLPWR
ncbi:MAG: hypothetical protein ACI4OV_07625 [Victivallaceae bacterium]